MNLEHQVWARPPGKDKQDFFAAFELSRWQWAEKLAQYLTDKGFDEVEVRLAEEQEEEEGDEEE